MTRVLRRYLRVLAWVWLLGGLGLGLVATADAQIKHWLLATAERMSSR